jgi:hypothetical protein
MSPLYPVYYENYSTKGKLSRVFKNRVSLKKLYATIWNEDTPYII